MKLLLNLIPWLFLVLLALCGYSYWSGKGQLTNLVIYFTVLIPVFITSLAWRASYAGTGKKIAFAVFLIAAVCSAMIFFNPESARALWMYPAAAVLFSVHLFLFTICSGSFLFSGSRMILLYIPFAMSVFGLIGMWLWNGTLAISSIGLIIAVLFAVLTLLFGYKKPVVSHEDVRENEEKEAAEAE